MDSEALKKLVTGFISEMNAWEKKCEKISDSEDNDEDVDDEWEEMEKKVHEIFSRFCTPKDRKQGRPNVISWGSEGSYDYDPKEELIKDTVEEKAGRFLVYTYREKPLKTSFCYVILETKGKLRIDSKKRKFNVSDKWENDYL